MNADDLLKIEAEARAMVRSLSNIGWGYDMIEPALDGITALWYGPKPRLALSLACSRLLARNALLINEHTAKRLAFEVGMRLEMWGEW